MFRWPTSFSLSLSLLHFFKQGMSVQWNLYNLGYRRLATTALKFDVTNEKAKLRRDTAQGQLLEKLGKIEKEATIASMKDQCSVQ